MSRIKSFADMVVAKGITVEFKTLNGTKVYEDLDVEKGDNRITLSKTVDGKCAVQIDAIITDRTALCTIIAEDEDGFEGEDCVVIRFGELDKPDEIQTNYVRYACCSLGMAVSGYDALHERTMSLLARYGDTHYHMFTLCGDNFKTWMSANHIRLTTGKTGLKTVNGTFLTVSVADDPFVAIDNNFKDARAMGGIRVPLKEERTVTKDKFSGFGWCTWNVFEQQFTSQQVYAKVKELTDMGIPVEWVLIDDGWMPYTEDQKLISYRTDEEKIPEGMKAFVEKIKSYGVKYVGLWHTINAYWYGMQEGSPAYEEQKDKLVTLKHENLIVPSLDPKTGFAFWDEWYGYLADCGVDFVKIDNQTTYSNEVAEMDKSTREIMIDVHGYIEAAAQKYFNGDIFNCMGMDITNTLARPSSLIARNGEDFWTMEYPRDQFNYLMEQNIYNSLYHDKLYLCDYDMWWSTDITALRAAVLRSISGSINFISDPGEGFDKELIMKTLDEDGKVLFCDHASYPTLDCVYGYHNTSILRIWNKSGDCFGIAAFNMGKVKETDLVKLNSISGIDKERQYVTYEYFTKKYDRATAETAYEVELDLEDLRIWSIYPIEKDEGGEYIMLGNTDKFLPIPSKFKKKTYLKDIM